MSSMGDEVDLDPRQSTFSYQHPHLASGCAGSSAGPLSRVACYAPDETSSLFAAPGGFYISQ